MNTIPYGRQHITEEDIKAVTETLLSTHLTQGPKIAEFEKKFAEYVGAEYAVAVCNGTAGLHIAALSLGLQPGDKVITTPITFSATANCIRYCGAEVVFADIDPDTWLLDIKKVRELLQASPRGTYKGIIPVDFAGRMVNLEAYRKLADEYGLWIIEDACHAPGAYFIDAYGHKQAAGNGQLAHASVFSFHPVKHIACGEGGMITTNDIEVYKELNRLRSHGITKGDDSYINSSVFACGTEDSGSYPGWYMEMQQLGYNYRMTDIQAALGVSQLSRAEQGLKKRRAIAQKYHDAFAGNTSVIRQSGYVEGHAYHLYVIEVRDRFKLYEYLKSNGILAQVHYIPVHLMPYYRQSGWKEGDMPHAENYYKHCISLPMYPTLTDEEQQYVINKVLSFVNGSNHN